MISPVSAQHDKQPVKLQGDRLSLRERVGQMIGFLDSRPILSVSLSVISFSFFGPLAALILVATMLDHEFAHRYLMRRFGYNPGPVRLIPLVGAFVRARVPMLRSADIALIYLAGPLAGILSAAAASLLASHALDPGLSRQVYIGASISIALNLFNLLPFEPLDGGLVSRVLPYPALFLFPIALYLWLLHAHMDATPFGLFVLCGAVWICLRKVLRWRRYVAALHEQVDHGDVRAVMALRASFEVPMVERILVVTTYVLLVAGGLKLLDILWRAGGWLH